MGVVSVLDGSQFGSFLLDSTKHCNLLLQIFSEASACMRVNPGQLPNGRACKYCLNTLMNIFTSSYMPRQVHGETLHRLMEALLLRLVDEQLPKLAEGEALLKVPLTSF
jgi:hypothetical protein